MMALPSISDMSSFDGTRNVRAGQTLASMLCGEVEHGTERNDPGWIDRAVALVIVPPDMLEIHRLGDAGPLIDVARKGGQIRIVAQPPDVALEVPDIDRVEADQCREQADIGFGQAVSEQEAPIGKAMLEPVQCVEQRHDGFLVGLL